MTDRLGPAGAYVDDMRAALARLATDDLDTAVRLVAAQVASQRAIFIAGNGGASSVAGHMASDWRAAAVATHGRAGEISSLTDNTARLTAIANDHSYDEVFSRQVAERAVAGDLLVCLSVSGSSPNIVRAAVEARSWGVTVLSLVGRVSPLVHHSDHAVLLDVDGDYGLTEDLQSLFIHLAARAVRGVARHRADVAANWSPPMLPGR